MRRMFVQSRFIIPILEQFSKRRKTINTMADGNRGRCKHKKCRHRYSATSNFAPISCTSTFHAFGSALVEAGGTRYDRCTATCVPHTKPTRNLSYVRQSGLPATRGLHGGRKRHAIRSWLRWNRQKRRGKPSLNDF